MLEDNLTSDGDVKIVTDTVITRDMFYDKLTIVGDAAVLNPDGFIICLRELVFEKE